MPVAKVCIFLKGAFKYYVIRLVGGGRNQIDDTFRLVGMEKISIMDMSLMVDAMLWLDAML